MNFAAKARHLVALHAAEMFRNAEGGSLSTQRSCLRQTPSYTPPASAYDPTQHGKVHEVITDTSDAISLLSDEQFCFAFGHELDLVCPVQILAKPEQAEIFEDHFRVHHEKMTRLARVAVALEVIYTIAESDAEARFRKFLGHTLNQLSHQFAFLVFRIPPLRVG